MNRVAIPSLALCLLLLASCGSSKKEAQEQVATMAERDTSVTSATLKGTNYEVTLSQPGTTYAIRDIELESRVTGYVERVEFEDGAIVKKGDRLFQIDPRPYEAALLQARGNLESAVAARNLADRTVERNQPLVKTGAISREQFDTYVTDLERAEGDVETAAGQLVDAELNLSFTEIQAPFTGRLGQRQVELGDLVQQTGSPQLISIVQYDPMRALISVPAAQLNTLVTLKEQGDIHAQVRVNGTRGGGGKVFKGVVDFIDNQVNQMTSTVMVRVRFDNPEAWAFPGQYCEVELGIRNIPDAIVIPQEALRAQQGGGRFVWIIGEKNKISRQDVTVGSVRGGQAWISKGLRAGQRIVVLGSTELSSGAVVKIVTDPGKVKGSASQQGGSSTAAPSTKSSAGGSSTAAQSK